MSKIYSKILLLFLVGVLFSCAKNKQFEDTPGLKWESAAFVQSDSTANKWYARLNLYFTDGDGDIGFEADTSTIECDTTNFDLFIRYFEQVDGTFQEVFPTNPCLPFHNRLPYLTPEGQNKTLEGVIKTPFDYSGFPRNNTDSVKFEVYIKDRTGHTSNVVLSPSIFVPEL